MKIVVEPHAEERVIVLKSMGTWQVRTEPRVRTVWHTLNRKKAEAVAEFLNEKMAQRR